MIRPQTTDAVVLLHGLAAHRWVMTPLANTLAADGYGVANWGYPSLRRSIEVHAQEFGERLSNWMRGWSYERVHVVAHSMGCIVARRAFSRVRPCRLGKFVMLAPPNGGSSVARKLASPLGRWCPPLAELSDAPDSYVNSLGPPQNLELGIVAAALDRVVQLESTLVDSPHHHIVLPGHHGTLPWRRDTGEQVIHFLRCGEFRCDPDKRDARGNGAH